MSLWFPIRLMQTIRQVLPRVDPFTELGRKRSKPEMEIEYRRLLERDQSTLGFLYKGENGKPTSRCWKLTFITRLPKDVGHLQIRLSLGKAFSAAHCCRSIVG
jgi:hypothetical protein